MELNGTKKSGNLPLSRKAVPCEKRVLLNGELKHLHVRETMFLLLVSQGLKSERIQALCKVWFPHEQQTAVPGCSHPALL